MKKIYLEEKDIFMFENISNIFYLLEPGYEFKAIVEKCLFQRGAEECVAQKLKSFT